jgi:large subunit ribosomal protein L19e
MAAQVLDVAGENVWFDTARLAEIKDAITKADIKQLIKNGAIQIKTPNHQSRSRARVRTSQRQKGRQRGHGSKKGKTNARVNIKRSWITRLRVLRNYIKTLRDKDMISRSTYHNLYNKSKGGFFRNKRHMKLYVDEHELIQKEEK